MQYGLHYVYQLTDPRSGEAFYIGVSKNPGRRLGGHYTTMSAAYTRVHEILASGYIPLLDILEGFENRQDAFDRETVLISERPGLVNLSRPTVFDRLMKYAPGASDLVFEEPEYVPLEEFEAEDCERTSFRKRALV